jgi:hypothetical protein
VLELRRLAQQHEGTGRALLERPAAADTNAGRALVVAALVVAAPAEAFAGGRVYGLPDSLAFGGIHAASLPPPPRRGEGRPPLPASDPLEDVCQPVAWSLPALATAPET